MTALLLPVAAACFWAGILLLPSIRGVPPMGAIAVGLALLSLAAVLAPGRRSHMVEDPLVSARLAPPDPPAIAIPGVEEASPARAPPTAALAMVLAFVVLGAVWAGLRVQRLAGTRQFAQTHIPLT